jgi:micrococcal nuclease
MRKRLRIRHRTIDVSPRRALFAFVVGAVLVASVLVSGASPAPGTSAVVASVIDGDTLRLGDGRRVRLIQIDSPEVGTGECYSRAARTTLLRLTPVGSRVLLEVDPTLDKMDSYGRPLRYVFRKGVNANIEMVRRGAAAPYFYNGDRGRYAGRLMAAAVSAQESKRGLWKACPRTILDPTRAVDTGQSGPSLTPAPTTPAPNTPAPTTPLPVVPPTTGKCDPNYTGGCVPPYPPDVDCADIRALGIAPVRVIGTDVHRLDGDGDGGGCE